MQAISFTANVDTGRKSLCSLEWWLRAAFMRSDHVIFAERIGRKRRHMEVENRQEFSRPIWSVGYHVIC